MGPDIFFLINTLFDFPVDNILNIIKLYIIYPMG